MTATPAVPGGLSVLSQGRPSSGGSKQKSGAEEIHVNCYASRPCFSPFPSLHTCLSGDCFSRRSSRCDNPNSSARQKSSPTQPSKAGTDFSSHQFIQFPTRNNNNETNTEI